MSADPLLQAQDDFYGRLLADPYFEDVAVLKQRDGVVESTVETALSVFNSHGDKIGACVIVLMPELEPKQPNVSSPEANLIQAVQVVEMPAINFIDGGTRKSAEQIGTRVRQLFHRFYDGSFGTWYLAGDEPIPRPTGQVSRGIRFMRHHEDEVLAKVAAPGVSIAGAALPYTVTLSCATSGATIRYTLDGSLPTYANEAAQLYTAPFDIVVPCTLRVCADATDMLQSDIAETTFS